MEPAINNKINLFLFILFFGLKLCALLKVGSGDISNYKKSSFAITKVPDFKPQREILLDGKYIKRKGFK